MRYIYNFKYFENPCKIIKFKSSFSQNLLNILMINAYFHTDSISKILYYVSGNVYN